MGKPRMGPSSCVLETLRVSPSRGFEIFGLRWPFGLLCSRKSLAGKASSPRSTMAVPCSLLPSFLPHTEMELRICLNAQILCFTIVFLWYLDLWTVPWTSFKSLPSTQCHCLPLSRKRGLQAVLGTRHLNLSKKQQPIIKSIHSLLCSHI